MTPIQALSQFRANILPAAHVWALAKEHLHEHIGWSAVLSHALTAEPGLHPELHALLKKAAPSEHPSVEEDHARIASVFKEVKDWVQTLPAQEIGPVLAIWASQTQINECTVADLASHTPLAWRWGMAVALMPVEDLVRPEHQTLVHVLWMEHVALNQSKDQQVDPSILSSAFSA